MDYIIKEFNGGHGVVGQIGIEKHKCSLCGKDKLCIAADGSEGEYDYACICADCVTSEINKVSKQENL